MDGNMYTMRDILHRPVSIRSTSGAIVVTSAGDSCDHVLESGESLQIRPKGLLAIRGLSDEARALIFGGRSGRTGRELLFRG